MSYHVVCLRPGMHRGGHANPLHAHYEDGDHTVGQLQDLAADPNIVIIHGGERLTLAHLDAMQAEADIKSAAAHEAMKAAAKTTTPAKKA